MQTLELGGFLAALDPMTGSGLLALAAPTGISVGLDSLDAAEWESAFTQLRTLGWVPSEDARGDFCHEGMTPDGRSVIGLYGLDPVCADPTIEACADAFAELRRLVGIQS